MSTEFLCITSTDPSFVPTIDTREAAVAAFRKMLPTAGAVDAIYFREIRFIDPGMRFELVSCPLCESELDQIWWGDAMCIAEKSGFRNLSVMLPCCDAPSTLNNLIYKMPAGFARFLLRASDSKLGRYLTVDKLQALEAILGTQLQQIWTQQKDNENEMYQEFTPKITAGSTG